MPDTNQAEYKNRTKCNIAYLRLLEWIQIVYSNCWENFFGKMIEDGRNRWER